MQIGELREHLELQAATVTQDGTGGDVTTWTKVCNLWGKVSGLGGAELMAARQVSATTSLEVVIRFYPGLTGRYRLVWGERILNIDSVTDREGTRRWMWVQCTERT
jgi:SPP1 family predicted phage head-tail adaptor